MSNIYHNTGNYTDNNLNNYAIFQQPQNTQNNTKIKCTRMNVLVFSRRDAEAQRLVWSLDVRGLDIRRETRDERQSRETHRQLGARMIKVVSL